MEGHDEEAPHGDEQRTVDRHCDRSYDLCKMADADDIRKYTLLNLIAKDEDKQTEEIELRKLRKSSVKVFKDSYEEMKELRE